jgi:hypothetical protein
MQRITTITNYLLLHQNRRRLTYLFAVVTFFITTVASNFALKEEKQMNMYSKDMHALAVATESLDFCLL